LIQIKGDPAGTIGFVVVIRVGAAEGASVSVGDTMPVRTMAIGAIVPGVRPS
jgi:hypothetical protein